jgi:hypothetical protein
MRRSISLMLALFGILSIFVSPVQAQEAGAIRLSLIEGDVQVQIKDSTDWIDADVNLPMNEGDRVWVGDGGRAELQIHGGVSVRLGQQTSFDILTTTANAAQFYLDRGHVYVNNRRGGIQTVQIDTPLSSIRSYDNSIMMVDAAEDDSIEVSMLKGFAYAETRSGAARVSAGNALEIRGDSAVQAPIAAPDEWEQWNTDRDRTLYAWGESSRYLPEELHEYAADFESNGRWDYASDYGYVWTPTIVEPGWAPYSVGSWIWMRGQYVWIARDRWCWAPSHYGRWVFTAWGWSWVPPAVGAVYWGPGFVGWIVTPTYVAWVPLAPGEIYYGHGYYGPWSRNIAAGSANSLARDRIFVNAKIGNAVVAVELGSFGYGPHRRIELHENPFQNRERHREDWSELPPSTRPGHPVVIKDREHDAERHHEEHVQPPRKFSEHPRETFAPSVTMQQPTRKPTERSQPPDRVRNTRPDEVKNERRLVKEHEASVFRERAPETLTVKKLNAPRESSHRQESKPKKNAGETKDRTERKQER